MELLSPELPQFVRLIVALLVVLALMWGLSLLMRKLGLSNTIAARTGGEKRLKLLEVLPLDARRRLAIVQCDQKQYLIMLGAQGEVLIDDALDPVDSSGDSSNST